MEAIVMVLVGYAIGFVIGILLIFPIALAKYLLDNHEKERRGNFNRLLQTHFWKSKKGSETK